MSENQDRSDVYNTMRKAIEDGAGTTGHFILKSRASVVREVQRALGAMDRPTAIYVIPMEEDGSGFQLIVEPITFENGLAVDQKGRQVLNQVL